MAYWIIVALISYFFASVSDVFDKVARDKFIRNSYALIILNGFLNLAIAIILTTIRPNVLIASGTPLMIAGGIIGIWASVPYFQALSRSEASRISPLFNFISIFSLVLSFVFIGESLSNVQLAAFAFIVSGGFLISMKSIRGAFRLDSGFWLMMLSCLMYAVSFVFIKNTLQSSNFYTVQIFVAIGYFIGGMLLIPYSLYLKKIRVPDLHFKLPAIGIQSVNQSSYLVSRLLQNIAFVLAPVAIVLSLQGFIGFFVLIIATFLSLAFPRVLREELSKQVVLLKISAIALMFIGVWLLNII